MWKFIDAHTYFDSFQVKEQQVTMEEKFRNELNANIKLSNLYKVFMTSILP